VLISMDFEMLRSRRPDPRTFVYAFDTEEPAATFVATPSRPARTRWPPRPKDAGHGLLLIEQIEEGGRAVIVPSCAGCWRGGDCMRPDADGATHRRYRMHSEHSLDG
jgi:hypothetical protein